MSVLDGNHNIEILSHQQNSIENCTYCAIKSKKHAGKINKNNWLADRFEEGMFFKTVRTDSGDQAHIEYIPGKYAWRAIHAEEYMVIHCIMTGKKDSQHQGHASLLIQDCIEETMRLGLKGVAVVTSGNSFLASKDIFLKHKFESVDTAPPKFDLMVLKFDQNTKSPVFAGNWEEKLNSFGDILTVLYSDQCPYTEKAIKEMRETSHNAEVPCDFIKIESAKDAQNAPLAYGSFGVIYQGKLIEDHPISNGRFKNIIKKIKS